MLASQESPQRAVRSLGRWIGAVSAAAALVLGAAGCSAELAAQSSKSAAEDADAATGIEELRLDVEADDALSMENPGDGTASDGNPGDEASGDGAAPQAASGKEDTQAPRIHMTIASDPQLTLHSKRIVGAHNYDDNPSWWCRDLAEAKRTGRQDVFLNLPEYVSSVAPVGKSESCIEGNREDLEMELTYRIADGEYLLHVYSTVPNFGYNKIECTILEAATMQRSGRSDYRCSVAWLQQGDWYNPMPKVHLQNK